MPELNIGTSKYQTRYKNPVNNIKNIALKIFFNKNFKNLKKTVNLFSNIKTAKNKITNAFNVTTLKTHAEKDILSLSVIVLIN